MKRLTVLAVALALSAWGADKPDFSGNWELSVAKSSFGKMSKPVGMSLTATRQGDGYHSVQKIVTADNGTTATEGSWYLDGQEHTDSSGAMKTMSKWEGNVLYAERKSTDGKYEEVLRISISSDGKTATEHIKAKTPTGDNSSTLVWNRK